MKQRCSDCVFWVKSGDTGKGFCRRYPPLIGERFVSVWPETMHTDWCGEYASRKLHEEVAALFPNPS